MMRTTTILAAALLVLPLAACGGQASTTSSAPEAKTLTVFAAASMQTTFTELATTFEAAHPGAKVAFNFAGSQALAAQLVEGATADVFVSANDAQMKVVTDAGLASGTPKVFATNQLTIAVPPDNPKNIATLKDLAASGVKLVICASAVPCGAATQQVEKASGITLTPVSEEQAVTGVLGKVRSGEADAGLVYRTDVIATSGAVKGIEFPESSLAINRNPVVLLAAAPQPELGQAWIDLLVGKDGQAVLSAAGFGPGA